MFRIIWEFAVSLYSIRPESNLMHEFITLMGCVSLILTLSGSFNFPERYTKMKTATNIYIFNLAVADALVTTTMPFQSTDYLLNSWPFGEVVCKVFISIDYYNMFTSIFTLTMMSVDRYVAVCHPIKALDFRTPMKAKIINILIWVLSSAAGIPAMVLGSTQTNNGRDERYKHYCKTFLSLISLLCLLTQAAFI